MRWSALNRFGPYTLAALIWRGGCLCAWCGIRVVRSTHCIDHLVSRYRGGTDSYDNVVLSCRVCNDSRGDSDWMSESLWTRVLAAGRTEQDCVDAINHQISIPVGRGSTANKCARPILNAWFGVVLTRVRRVSRDRYRNGKRSV